MVSSKKLLFFVVFLFTIACSKSPFTDEPTNLRNEKSTQDFNYTSQYTVKKMRLNQSGQDCLFYDFIFETTYPQSPEKFEVVGHLYRPKKSGFKAPVVVLFPPVGGKNVLDEDMAETLCSNEIAVFLPTNDFTGIDQSTAPPVEDHDHALHRVVASTKAFISYSKKHYRLNGNEIGIFGASLGGIIGVFTMGVLPEVSAGYFIVAGGDVPYILAHSTQSEVVKVKRQRYREEGFRNDTQYEAWLRQNLLYDPLDYAGNIPSSMIYMVISNNDKSVPTIKQFELHDALGNPSHHISSSDHFWTVVNSMSGNNRNIADYFKRQFAKENFRLP